MRDIVLGDWVRTQYGRIGRVIQKHHCCPQSDEWLAMQTTPVTAAQKDGPWCSVLIDGGGSVVQPIDTLSPVDEPPEFLAGPWARFYFGEVVNAH